MAAAGSVAACVRFAARRAIITTQGSFNGDFSLSKQWHARPLEWGFAIRTNMKAVRDYKSLLLAVITLAVFVIAVWVLHHSLAKLSLSDVLASMEAEPWTRVAACAFFSACSYG